MEPLAKYLDLLATQMQHDAEVLSSGWMYTIVPLLWFLVYAALKWYVLLMPVTLPLTLWGIFRHHDGERPKLDFLNRN